MCIPHPPYPPQPCAPCASCVCVPGSDGVGLCGGVPDVHVYRPGLGGVYHHLLAAARCSLQVGHCAQVCAVVGALFFFRTISARCLKLVISVTGAPLFMAQDALSFVGCAVKSLVSCMVVLRGLL
jgi:hypothetical protein